MVKTTIQYQYQQGGLGVEEQTAICLSVPGIPRGSQVHVVHKLLKGFSSP